MKKKKSPDALINAINDANAKFARSQVEIPDSLKNYPEATATFIERMSSDHCRMCEGTGKWTNPMKKKVKCPSCKGTGKRPNHLHPLRIALLSELVDAVGGYNANPPLSTGRYGTNEDVLGNDDRKIVLDLLKSHKHQIEHPLNEKMKTLALRLFDTEAVVQRLTDEKKARTDWLEKAKDEAGFNHDVSFDVVWAAALKALRNGGAGWTRFDKDNPPPELHGPGHTAGWTLWYECADSDRQYDDHAAKVFTASYSYRLRRWQDSDQNPCHVTHYRLLPTKESLQ